jgi:hypothetical protein
MKTVDLSKGEPSLTELLSLAKSDAVLIHSRSGDDFVLEQADGFDREALALGRSERFMSFLEARASEKGDIALVEARKRRGMDSQ